MGSAFSVPCLDRQHNVNIVGTHLEKKFIDEINNNNNWHPALKLHLSKKTNFVKFSNLTNELKKEIDLIVLAVSSKGINWAVDQLTTMFHEKYLPPILMLTKGLSIYENKYELLVDKFERLIINKGFKNINVSAVGGPCLAKGLANKAHTSVVIANKNLVTTTWLKDILSTDYFHLFYSDDIIGVEICAAIKNIFAMIIGSSKRLDNETKEKEINDNNYLNTAASLITQSLHEMSLFVDFLKGNVQTVYGLAGLGDLYVSAQGGRNSMMGSYIGNGYTYTKAKKSKMLNETVEGAELIFEIGPKIKKDFKTNIMPLMIEMINTILYDKQLTINWNDFKKH